MASTAFGPQSANYTINRPATDAVASTVDTWFKPCTAGQNDGTVVDASWLNVVVAQLRTAVRQAGVTLDDTDDTMLWQAIEKAATYVLPQATNNALGGVKLATVAETVAGTDTGKAVTPADLAALIAQRGCPCPPTAGFASMTVQTNGHGAIDLSTLVGGNFASIALLSGGSIGTSTLNGSILTYTAGATAGNDVVTWQATNSYGVSNTGRVRLTVATPLPPAPVVANESFTVATGGTLTINLATYTQGSVTSWAIATAPAHAASYSLNGSTVTLVAPAAGGSDSFTYTATGPGGTSTQATVSLTYQAPQYAAPTVKPSSLAGAGGNSQSLNLATLTTGNVTSWAIVTAPGSGCTASISGSTLTVQFPNANGNDALTYTATGPGGTSTQATINLSFTAINPPTPTATAPPPPAPTVSSNLSATSTPGSVYQIDLSAHGATTGQATSWSLGLITSSGIGNGTASLNGPILTINAPNRDPNNPYGDCALYLTVYASGPGGTGPGTNLTFETTLGDGAAAGLPPGVWVQIDYPDGTVVQN